MSTQSSTINTLTLVFKGHTVNFCSFLRTLLPSSVLPLHESEEITLNLLCFLLPLCLCSIFVFFSLLLFCLLLLPSFFLTEKISATGFLSLHIVLLLRKVSLFLMSSASVALSLRLSTTDLLAFGSFCLLLSLLILCTLFLSLPIKLFFLLH